MNKFLILIIFVFSHSTFSQEKCLSGKPGNNHLSNQLKNAQANSPISKLISAKYGIGIQTEADVCVNCENTKNPIVDHQKVAKEKTFIKTECVEAAGTIQMGTNEISCPDAKIAKHNFCFTKKHTDYQNAVLSEFYKCVKSVNPMPLTIQGLFEIYTLESGFKPAYSSRGGNGLGQLTSVFIKDLHQKHRGKIVFNKILNSNEPSCEAAKLIIQKDNLKQPTLDNKCDFTQYGEGLERNMLYTVTGLANTWNKNISPRMKNYSAKYSGNPFLQRAQEKALMNSYGFGGNAAAYNAIFTLSHLAPKNFVAAMDKPLIAYKNGDNSTAYTMRIKKKQDIIGQKLSEPLKSQFAKEKSSACLE